MSEVSIPKLGKLVRTVVQAMPGCSEHVRLTQISACVPPCQSRTLPALCSVALFMTGLACGISSTSGFSHHSESGCSKLPWSAKISMARGDL